MNRPSVDTIKSPLHVPAPHESAKGHVTGRAKYVDDLSAPAGMLWAQVVPSPVAKGILKSVDVQEALLVDGVVTVLTAKDIPGENQIGPIFHDEPLLATRELECSGQAIALVVGTSLTAVQAGCDAVRCDIEEKTPLLDMEKAIAQESFQLNPHVIARGDVSEALASSAHQVSGTFSNGAQDHFYLETHAALVIPQEQGGFAISSSTQHPTEVQAKVAEVLGVGRHKIVVDVPRMGGGFGGKETQGAHVAALATLAALHTDRPVKIRLNRDQDMHQTGKRHPFISKYKAGFSESGDLLALDVNIYADGGWSSDLSGAILDRALFHLDNCYHIPNLRFEGRVLKTNHVSHTAFRGFGGPQGMLVVEEVMNRIAETLGKDPVSIRKRNYYGKAPKNITPYGQEVKARDNRIHTMTRQLLSSSQYRERRREIDKFNRKSKWIKKGIGFQPVKFGISFTNSMLNQAGALILVYADGTVHLNHGGTEMGQGLHTKMLAICAHELGVPLHNIRMMNTSTEKVPNTSATAASSGADLNGQAVRDACLKIRRRMAEVAASEMGLSAKDAKNIVFEDGIVRSDLAPKETLRFETVATKAWMAQVSLSATGFYRTPNIHYDYAAGRGKPFHYFAYGTAVSEVEVNGLTGGHLLTRVDILHDVGDSLSPAIDIGQVEGGFVQGLGWLTMEDVLWTDQGKLISHCPSVYKIPAVGDTPQDFHVSLLEKAPQKEVIHGSKAVGEPPFMLAISAVSALRHAILSYGKSREVKLASPATPEAILRAIESVKNGG